MEFEKSRTWANLMSAFAGESQARTKYENYARKASEQGYEQIAAIFRPLPPMSWPMRQSGWKPSMRRPAGYPGQSPGRGPGRAF